MRRLKNIHPGEVLKEEFLVPLNISAYRLSKDTFIPQTRISEILKGNRRITADTALRLSKYFGTTFEQTKEQLSTLAREAIQEYDAGNTSDKDW